MKKFILFFSLIPWLAGCDQTADIDPVGNGLFMKYYGNGTVRDVLQDIPEGRTLSVTSGGQLIGVGTVAIKTLGDTILSQAYVFSLDKNGFLSDENLFGDSYISRAVDMISSGGDHYLLINTVDGGLDGTDGMQIIKLNDGLTSSWSQKYSFLNENKGRAISLDGSGNLIVLGNYNPDGTGNEKMFTARIGADGSLLWVDSLGITGKNNPVGKSISVYTEGNQRYAWCGDDMNKTIFKPKLIITDEEGNIWENDGIEADSDLKESGSELLRTGNGTFVIIGYIERSETDRDMRLVRLTNNGGLIWTKDFGGTLNDFGASVCESEDKGLMVLGTTQSFGTSLVVENTSSDFYLVKTGGSGSVIWEKTYGGAEDDVASKIINIDGGYAIIGTSEVAGTKLITVIRTDLEGNYL